MKVLYYQRFAESSFHLHASSWADLLYVPDEGVILYRQKVGTFGDYSYSLTENAELLQEAKGIVEGKVPKEMDASQCKFLECQPSQIKELVRAARQKQELEEQVSKGIERLIARAGARSAAA